MIRCCNGERRVALCVGGGENNFSSPSAHLSKTVERHWVVASVSQFYIFFITTYIVQSLVAIYLLEEMESQVYTLRAGFADCHSVLD